MSEPLVNIGDVYLFFCEELKKFQLKLDNNKFEYQKTFWYKILKIEQRHYKHSFLCFKFPWTLDPFITNRIDELLALMTKLGYHLRTGQSDWSEWDFGTPLAEYDFYEYMMTKREN
jgi:hypothetical protein